MTGLNRGGLAGLSPRYGSSQQSAQAHDRQARGAFLGAPAWLYFVPCSLLMRKSSNVALAARRSRNRTIARMVIPLLELVAR